MKGKLIKIISGGQTGADRAGLDAAIESGIPHGGWIPKGRLTEDGPLPEKYLLREMPGKSYPARTEQNVLAADGTLILSHGRLTGGSALTGRLAIKHARPLLHLDLARITLPAAARECAVWLGENDIRVLNVAGPRASEDPDIYREARAVLEGVFALLA